jgi:hypothetical protein
MTWSALQILCADMDLFMPSASVWRCEAGSPVGQKKAGLGKRFEWHYSRRVNVHSF